MANEQDSNAQSTVEKRKRRHTPKRKRTTFRDGSGIFLVEFWIYPFFLVVINVVTWWGCKPEFKTGALPAVG
jgi:hypothetical protein